MASIEELLAEQRMTFGQLAQHQGVSPNTIWRWSHVGIRGVKLETYRLGGKRVTTLEAYHRFAAAISGVPVSTTASRRKSIAKAERILAASGI